MLAAVQARARPHLRPFTTTRPTLTLRIFLVRHGQSIANVNHALYQKMPDCEIPLSMRGQQEAEECGKQIKKMFEDFYGPSVSPSTSRARMWVSPYARTRQTAQIIREQCGGWIPSVYESLLLAEQQFGLFEGVNWLTVEDQFPKEVQYYRKSSQANGRFWVKMPLGESRFDVCNRVAQIFLRLHQDYIEDGINDVIIVSHGVTIRAFVLMFCHKPYEWFEKEPNPANCSIRAIYDSKDEGEIWRPNGQAFPEASQDVNQDPSDLIIDTERIASLIPQMDTNNDNYISEQEFIEAVIKKQNLISDEQLKALKRQYQVHQVGRFSPFNDK